MEFFYSKLKELCQENRLFPEYIVKYKEYIYRIKQTRFKPFFEDVTPTVFTSEVTSNPQHDKQDEMHGNGSLAEPGLN
ncbi:hypothetical protein DPMN_134042 [Dreissena polymorpha]|uniref:Uncharacterized protein n=1 Tax=Dreissena polymorpha TaxID=45954 RepID=A0A9D4FVG8_DREPO|nr:hypothetical protein DPMN_134042 [Dreissena polymorpha]